MKKNKVYGSILLIMCMLVFIGCGKTSENVPKKAEEVHMETETDQKLYEDSVKDAMVAEEDEIEPVIAITKDSKDVIWKNSTNQVLMFTLNGSPDAYPEKEEAELKNGEVWVSSAKEMIEWYQKNKDGVDDWTLRLKQLVGLPEEDTSTHMTAFWVKPDDMFRPAYVEDITDTDMTTKFNENVNPEYKQWFDNNIIFSYYDSAYPWTRLGYTYDWADNGTKRGLCEFIVKKGSKVNVEFTKTVDDFIGWLDTLDEKEENKLGQE